MRAGLIQLKIEYENQEKNFKKIKKYFSRLKNKGLDIVCIPELFSTGVTNKPLKFQETTKGETIKLIKNLAIKNKVMVIGSFIENDKNHKKNKNDSPFNTSIVINKKGKIISKYKKTHLFSYNKEHKVYSPGDKIKLFGYKGVKIGHVICYDLRFPELFRKLTEKGAKIIFVQANWPYPRQDHWINLLKARAIENQVFIIGVNCIGSYLNNKFFGKSMIIGPSGEILAEADFDKEQSIQAKLDLKKQEKLRKSFSCLKDIRNDLY